MESRILPLLLRTRSQLVSLLTQLARQQQQQQQAWSTSAAVQKGCHEAVVFRCCGHDKMQYNSTAQEPELPPATSADGATRHIATCQHGLQLDVELQQLQAAGRGALQLHCTRTFTVAAAASAAAAGPGSSGRGRVTTESRAAIEDVAIMSRSQLSRRNKAWLQEQCWQRGLDHSGVKDLLVGRLVEWQASPEGQEAAEEARQEARAALANPAPAVAAAAALQQQQQQQAGAVDPALVAAALQQAGAASSSTDAAAAPLPRRRRRSTTAKAADGAPVTPEQAADADVTPSSQQELQQAGPSQQLELTHSQVEASPGLTVTISQPAAAAAAAAADPLVQLGVLMSKLQASPGGRTAVAAARNLLEKLAAAGAAQPAELAGVIRAHVTSPQGLVALARACYGREELDPAVAAALAEVLAGAAGALGPAELHAVLRLMAAHPAQHTGRGLRVLAEALVGQGEALSPLALSESVQLLQAMGFDDAWGLYLITKEAARRLVEFSPGDLLGLVGAMADMAVGDAELAGEVAGVVAGWAPGHASQQQLEGIQEALTRMGLEAWRGSQ